jgi:RNA polymerase sigma-70 factor (ECF subfamily)
MNLAYMMIGNRHDAEDIAQEAFIRAYKALGKFQQRSKFSSWLYQIGLNLCKDHLKSNSRHVKHLDDEQLRAMEDGSKSDGQATQHILEVELSNLMREAIGKLPVPYRETFVLRHLQGLEYEDVASITAVPADTVRVRAYRARELLRELLAPEVDTYWREKSAREKSDPKL